MFDTLSDRLTSVLQNLRGKGKLTDADIDSAAREIRVALLEADVALPVVKQFIARIKERAKGAEVSAALNPAQQVIKIVNEELVAILGGESRRLNLAKHPPTVIMLAGLQGSGKTTLAGKLGLWLKKQGHAPMLAACDLQRPNAVTQLQVVGERAGLRTFAPEAGNGVGDPVAVARDAVEEARRAQHDIVIVDTAGRLGVDEEMMRQAADIRDAVTPDETLFVLDAMVGQDAVATAEAFRDGVGFSGVALAKLDGDARGGAALSVRHVTGEPILFASNGEKVEDFDLFHPDRMASRILGMGDMLTLIEQAEQAFDEERAEQAANKMSTGELTLEDFLEQMLAVRKMGPIGNLIGMMPGANQMKDQMGDVDDNHLDRLQAIIRGMTPAERANPKMINASRRQRIAAGSGVAIREVNDLVNRFFEARKMMQQMAGSFGFGGGSATKKATKKDKSKKGKKGKNAKGKQNAQPKVPGGMPQMPSGGKSMPDLSQLGGSMDELPPGFDPSKLKLPKNK